MLRESFYASSWLAWCYVKSSPAGMRREQEIEEAHTAIENTVPEAMTVPEPMAEPATERAISGGALPYLPDPVRG